MQRLISITKRASRRLPRKLVAVSAAVLSIGVLAPAAGAGVAGAAPAVVAGDGLAVLEALDLPGPMVAARLAPDVTFVGTAGSVLSREPGTGVVRVDVPEVPYGAPALTTWGWTPSLIETLTARIANGADLEPAVAALEPARLGSVSVAAAGPNDYVSAGCQEVKAVDNDYWFGCWRTKQGTRDAAGNLYRGDEFYAISRAAQMARTTKLTAGFTYGAAEAINVSPKSDISGNNCGSVTIGISGWGMSLSESQPVCPSRISPTTLPNEHMVTWHGHRAGQVATEGVVLTRTPAGELRGQQFSNPQPPTTTTRATTPTTCCAASSARSSRASSAHHHSIRGNGVPDRYAISSRPGIMARRRIAPRSAPAHQH